MNSRTSTFITLALVLGLLVLSAALAYLALNRRIYYVGTQHSGKAVPGQVPEIALRNFAVLYVNTFETFTPGTLEQNDLALKRLIHPRHYAKVSQMLEHRRSLVAQGQITSIFVPDISSVSITTIADGKYEAGIVGTRKIYLSDQLNQHTQIQYRVVIQAAAPTFTNPFGLFVVGHGATPARKGNRE